MNATVTELNPAAVQERLDRLARIEADLDCVNRTGTFHRLAALEAERREGRRTGWGPVVGLPCTYHIGSDAYAAVVTWVSPSAHQIEVKTGHDKEGQLFTLRQGGSYRSKGRGSGYIEFCTAETKLDPGF